MKFKVVERRVLEVFTREQDKFMKKLQDTFSIQAIVHFTEMEFISRTIAWADRLSLILVKPIILLFSNWYIHIYIYMYIL